ncbi:MAG: hypothetical protein AB1513_01525 [Pseudomonadota bacterium]
MFNWFGRGKPDHPLADAKQARKLLSELPADDAFKALEDIYYWIKSLNATPGFNLLHRYEIVDMLDQAARPYQRKLAKGYLSTPRLQKLQESRMWNTEFEFWRELGQAYLQCLDQFIAEGRRAESFRPLLPALCARIVRTLNLQMKWVLLRYGALDEELWRILGRVYRYAEEGGFERQEVRLYPRSSGNSSVHRETKKLLMLSISSADSLLPVTLEISERIVSHFANFFSLERTPGTECNYFFDLNMGAAPSRLVKDMTLAPSMRFFGAGSAYEELEKLSSQVAQGAVPPELDLGASYSPSVVLEVLLHLSQYWTQNLIVRGHERRKTMVRLSVVHGFIEIIGMLADGGATHDGNAESWVANNVSEGGYGAVIQQVQGDWVKIGSLLGIKPEGGAHWGVGVVRRLARDNQQRIYVGIQALAKAAIPVRLQPLGGAMSAVSEAYRLAMLLSSSPDSAGEITLLLKEATFSPTHQFEMLVSGKEYVLSPAKLLEEGEDYDLAKYRVSQRAS